MTILAIDAGTTGVTALLVTEDGRIAARGYQEFAQHFPQPGWVEHAPEEIWQAALAACRTALAVHTGASPTAIGITNQRETAVLWDRESLAAPRRAIVWQDRRTSQICDRLRDSGHEDQVRALTGLRLDPYFTGTKLTWLAENDEAAWSGVTIGATAIGTVDSYLVARLTGGRVHATDPSNASRTLLFDIHQGAWSDELCDLLQVPTTALPEVRRSSGDFGRTDPGAFLGLDLPIAGIAGDQQAALFGQACFGDGESKCTYGTGSFVLVNTGTTAVSSDAGLLTTVAWDIGDGLVYALEGAIFVTGAAVQWLRDGLGIISNASETEAVARTVSGHHSGYDARAPRARDPRGNHLRGARRRRRNDPRRGDRRTRTVGRRWRRSERSALRVAGDAATGAGPTATGRRDDSAWRRVPRRARHRHVVEHRRTARHLAPRQAIRARPARRRRLRPLVRRRTASSDELNPQVALSLRALRSRCSSAPSGLVQRSARAS